MGGSRTYMLHSTDGAELPKLLRTSQKSQTNNRKTTLVLIGTSGRVKRRDSIRIREFAGLVPDELKRDSYILIAIDK